jgi:hypothetical protein
MSGTVPGVVTFDYDAWVALFPEFASVSEATATAYFNMTTPWVDNTALGYVSDLNVRATLLNFLVAHIAAILNGVNGQVASPLVGRVSNATEGSVSVATDFPTTINGAWLNQTKYGALFWAASAPYRTMVYAAPLQPFFIPFVNV